VFISTGVGIETSVIFTSSATSIELAHDAGNLDFKVDEFAALPFYTSYQDIQQSDKDGGFLDDTFFFFDQSQYQHTGIGDIATGRESIAGKNSPEFQSTEMDISFSMIEDGAVDKSFGSFTKVEDINNQENDIRVFQTAWSKHQEDWGIIQWTIKNLYDHNLLNVRFGLRYYACIGGDNNDDKVYWNPTEKIYYLKDSGSAMYIGFASADPGNPINLYWDGPNPDLSRDIDIYHAITDSPYISGMHNDLGCVVGWTDEELTNNGLTISAEDSITRTLIMVGGTSYNELLAAIENAREFYLPRTLKINEIADEGQARVEVHNLASVPQDLTFIRLSVDGGSTYWLDGSWDPNLIPGYGFSVWNLTGGDSFGSAEGDTLGLFNYSLNMKLDEVAFGQEGVAPDPINDNTYGSISKVWYSDWVHSLGGMSFGAQNDGNGLIKKSPNVVINEVMFNPTSPEYGFIELMYIGYASIDLDGFYLITDSIYTISSHSLDSNDPFLILFKDDVPVLFENGNLSESGDNIYLYDNTGYLLDMVGWNTEHQENKTVKRVPEGQGTFKGHDDASSETAGWVFDSASTIPAIQVAPPHQFKYGGPDDVLWYDLGITNKMNAGELIEIYIQCLNGWLVELYKNDKQTKLTDSDGDGALDIFINALSSVDISIKIIIPHSGFSGDYGNTILIAEANSNSVIQSSAVMQTRFYPYLLPLKTVTPNQINVLGTGTNEEATITLNVTGRGFGIVKTQPQDVVLVIDRSESMLPGDVDLAKQYATEYVENMSSSDRGAVVHFDTNVVLMNSLTTNHNRIKNDIENVPGPGEFTYMGEALFEALQELNNHGQGDNSHVIILFTDGGWNGNIDPESVAYWARENRTFIFTVDLSGSQESTLLKEIAEITGGQYFPCESIEDFRAIYDELSTIIDKMAGYDPDPSDSNPLIRDVLPPGIEYIPGSFSITPDYIHVDDFGYTILEWNLSSLLVGETWIVDFKVEANTPGYQEANNYTSSRINYLNWEDLSVLWLFPKTMITVNPIQIPELIPPKLSIEAVDDSDNPSGKGNSIRLLWTQSTVDNIAYYLIYRSESQTGFDFSSHWVSTYDDEDNGIIPKRSTWNDTYASKPGTSNYRQEYYYIIRAVDTDGNISATSRTVGKWTKHFNGGLNTFSLPLEPLQTQDTEYYSTDMRAGYIKWMNSNHKWVRHDSGECQEDNTNVVVGDSYEVMFTFPTAYTFCGMPGAMIRYDDFSFGFDADPQIGDADSLSASVDNYGTITLSWTRPVNLNLEDRFYVLRSTTRDGFWGTQGDNYERIANLSSDIYTYEDFQVAIPGTEFYYMVIPINLSSGESGISSYSIGIWTANYDSDYDTLGLPLKMVDIHSIDWYCDEIQNVVGINYFNTPYKRWIWHSTRMPKGVYDVDVVMVEGYQVSTNSATMFSFIGL
jgi:hypothetical protein